ncbi:MAG: WG repeat-containing protein, partial [Deltaproteobacteria bacterium]|nr:WG repeat-containing protein [Deltaproteobacteria bacterium]
QEGKEGILDGERNIIVPLEYGYAFVHEAAGQVWFTVKNQEGKWGGLDARGNIILPFDYQDVTIYEAAGQTWFSVENQEGKEGILDGERNIIVPLEYGYAFVQEAAGQVWFTVKNREGKWGVLDARGNIILPFDYQDVTVCEAAGQAWFSVKNQEGEWGILDGERNIIVPLEYDFASVHEAAGQAWFWIKNRERGWEIWDSRKNHLVSLVKPDEFEVFEIAGRPWTRDSKKIFLLDARGPIEFDGLFNPVEGPEGLLLVGARGEYLPLWFWEEVLESEALQKRLDQLLSRRLDPSLLFRLRRTEEGFWDWALQEQNRSLLGLFQTPEALDFASQHYNSLEHSSMERALRLIKILPRPHTLPLSIYLERVATLFPEGSADITKALKFLERGDLSEEAQALKLYLTQREVVGIGKGELEIPGGGSRRLADVITHLRLSEAGAALEDIQQTKHYDNEEDRRQLEQAVLHLHGIHPFLWVREFLQNSLDALRMADGASGDRPREIRTDIFLEEGRLCFRLRDYAGMSEEEFLGLLQPGESAKRETAGFRGRFGVGFKAALAGAARVRLKTAVRGAGEVILAEWEVKRDRKGSIKDIRLKTEKRTNHDGFYGTVIETERDSRSPLLEGAQIQARLRDMGQYIRAQEAKLWHNGEWINEKRNGPLVVLHHETLGVIELYDGLENRLLLGGLPLTELPSSLWESVPAGIREYYRRFGFYLNLDHTRLFPTLTRDRLRDQEAVFATLERVLPGLLIHGFLKRVVSMEHQEDFAHLPPEYFIEAYHLADQAVLDPAILRDGRWINVGRLEEVEMDRYAKGERGQRELLKLLTVVRFLPVTPTGGQTRLMSFQDIHKTYHQARREDKEAGELLEKIRGLPLPPSILKRLVIADESVARGERVARQVEEESVVADHPVLLNFWPNRLYSLGQIKDNAVKCYLKLLQEVTQAAGRPFGIEEVETGIHTRKDHSVFFAYHFRQGSRYFLYRTYGPHLLEDVRKLTAIRALFQKDPERAAREFTNFLARFYEDITHELTHAIEERPERPDFTHDRHFRDRQRHIMTAPPITEETFRSWFSMAGAADY